MLTNVLFPHGYKRHKKTCEALFANQADVGRMKKSHGKKLSQGLPERMRRG
jgi:hypothetical protein